MFNKYNLQELNWNNYLELIKFIDEHDFIEEFWSPIAIMSWKFYGFDFYFHILNDESAIIFYIKNVNSNIFSISSSFYNKNFKYQEKINFIQEDLFKLNKNREISFDQISINMINDWNLDNNFHEINYVSNYIYNLETLKTFAGKKLQKKRNHLNYFLNNNKDISIKKIQDVNSNDILEYCNFHIKTYSEQFNKNELDVYNQFINCEMKKSNNFVGIVIYQNNKIIALTLCYLRKNICEVIIEKANKEIRGLYQFLISENLKLNNINQQYMDRQDDANSEQLAKSKMQYNPIYTIKRYSSK